MKKIFYFIILPILLCSCDSQKNHSLQDDGKDKIFTSKVEIHIPDPPFIGGAKRVAEFEKIIDQTALGETRKISFHSENQKTVNITPYGIKDGCICISIGDVRFELYSDKVVMSNAKSQRKTFLGKKAFLQLNINNSKIRSVTLQSVLSDYEYRNFSFSSEESIKFSKSSDYKGDLPVMYVVKFK